MGCFGPGKEVALAAEQLRQENHRLTQELAKLRTLVETTTRANEVLTDENRRHLDGASKARDMLDQVHQLTSANTQMEVALQNAEASITALENHHANELSSMKRQHQEQIKSLQASQGAQVHALETKMARYHKEKAKLMEHIERRDQALFLAGQVIDMVDKSGMLSLSDSLSASMIKAASGSVGGGQPDTARNDTQTVPGSTSPRLTPTSRSKQQQQAVSTQQLQHQHVLDELRRSIPVMRAALAGTQECAPTDITFTPPSSAANKAGDAGRPGNTAATRYSQLARSNSGEKNPLWQMTCCQEEQDAGGSPAGSPAPDTDRTTTTASQDSFAGLTCSRSDPREHKHSARYSVA